MKIRQCLIAVVASSSIASSWVMAHSSGHHDDDKEIPQTCEQLADTKKYTNDIAYPEVKKLKEQCDLASKNPPSVMPQPAGGSN